MSVDVEREALAVGRVGTEGDEVRRTPREIIGAIDADELRSLSAKGTVHRADRNDNAESDDDEARDTSFLGQLNTDNIARMEDLRTLTALMAGAALPLRRAATVRLGELLASKPRGEHVKPGLEALKLNRDLKVAYERSAVMNKLPGAEGRSARAERDDWNKLARDLSAAVRKFWDGELDEEPLTAMPGDDRAQLLIRVRDLPSPVLAHIAAALETRKGLLSRTERLNLLGALRYGNEPRLVPALRNLLGGGDQAFTIEGARSLGYTEDPRVMPTLRVAYSRAQDEVPRAVLAGALGRVGDTRGAPYVKLLLDSDDPAAVGAALEAARTCCGPEVSELVIGKLRDSEPGIRRAAIKTLMRIGDGRALRPLSLAHRETIMSSLRALIEDAQGAIRARLELRGEEPEGLDESVAFFQDELTSPGRTRRKGVRLRSRFDYAMGYVWLFLGGLERAVARFEDASQRSGGWAPPLVLMGMAYARKNRFAPALRAFRRAIELDRSRVERNPIVIHALTKTFLRRAEEVERDGRFDIAVGLLEEVRALDLRRATGALRFELERHHASAIRRLS